MLQNPLIDVPAEATPEEIAARKAAAVAPAGRRRDIPAEISPKALEARQALEAYFASKRPPPTPTEEMPAAGRFAGAAGGSAIGALGGGDAAAAVHILSSAAKRAAVAHKVNQSSQGRFLTETIDVVGEAARDWAKGALAVKDFLLPPEKAKGDLAERAGGFVGGLAGLGGVGAKFGAIGLGATGAGQAAAPVYYETLAKTGSEDKAIAAALPALGVGATYALPAGKLLAKAGSGAFGKLLLSVGAEGGLAAAQGGILTKITENATGEELDEAQRAIEDGAWGFLTTLGLGLLQMGHAKLSRGRVTPGAGGEALAEGQSPTQAPEAQAATGEVPATQAETPVATQPEAKPRPSATFQAADATSTETVAPLEGAAAGAASQEAQPAPTKTPAAEGTLPEPAKPVEAEPSKSTGIKHAVIERELEEMGLPMPEKRERRGFVELHAKAKQVFEESKGEAGRNLVDTLETNPRALDADEKALLVFEANRLKVERKAAEEAFLKNPSDANQKRIDDAFEAYKRAKDVFHRAGSESGSSLNAQKMMVAEDYSLAEVERQLFISRGGEDLPPSEVSRLRAEAKKLHADLEATRLAHEKYVTEANLKRADDEAEKALLRLKAEAKGKARRGKRAVEIEQTKKELNEILEEIGRRSRLKAGAGFGGAEFKLLAQAAGKAIKLGAKSFAQWADQMVARFGEDIRPHLDGAWKAAQGESLRERAASLKGKTPEEMHSGVQKIALDLVESGISDRDELTKAVHAVLQDVDPNITLADARDAISGYGKFRKLSLGEARRKLRDLKGQMQQVAKLEALQAKEAIKKTGFERQEPSAEQKRLSKQVRELQKKLGVPTADRLKALKTRTKNKIEDLERRIKEKDFADRPKPKPVELDPEAIRLKAAETSAQRRFAVAKEKEERAQRSLAKKGLDAAKEILDLPRALMSAFDFSAVRRQGGFFTSGHPLQSAAHGKKMIEAWASPRVANEVDAAIRQRPGHALGESAGLELTSADGVLGPAEEALRSKLSDKIPGIKASNRAYITYLNLQRVTRFDAMIEGLGHSPSLDEAKAIAAFVNRATGRATGKGKSLASRLEGVKLFWAPNYVVSRFQLAGEPISLLLPGKGKTRAVRKAIAKELVRYVAGQSTYYGLLGAMGAAIAEEEKEKLSIETDWRSSDFGKIKIGNTRVDPLSGVAQVVTFIAQMATGKRVTKGKAEEVNQLRTLARFGRSKLGPLQGRIADALDRKTFTGEKTTPAKALLRPPIPLSIGDIAAAMKELSVPSGMILGVLSLLGDSVQTYKDKKK